MLLTDQLGGQRVVKQARTAVHAGSAGGERENPHDATIFNWRSSRRPPNHVVYIGWSAEGAALCDRDWPIMVLAQEGV